MWEITSGFPALSAHVLVGGDSDCHAARREMEAMLHERFALDHTTLQVDHTGGELLEIAVAGRAAGGRDKLTTDLNDQEEDDDKGSVHRPGARHGRSSQTATDAPPTGRSRSTCACRKEMGGQGGGTNPEELFAVGYAACFEGALGTVARRSKAETGDVAIDSKVMLLPTEERGFTLAVELDVSLPSVEDSAEAVELVRAAHKVCPYSNATRGNIDVALTANGQPVE